MKTPKELTNLRELINKLHLDPAKKAKNDILFNRLAEALNKARDLYKKLKRKN